MYAKLFSSLYQGTLRGRSDEILVFTNLLAHCDKEGYVDKHFRAIAEETGINQDRVREAIGILEQPDDESRSPEAEGRRIVRIDDHRAWGWQVVNFLKYRGMRDEEARRETWRKSTAKRRARQQVSTVVNTCQPPSTHTEAEADTKVKEREREERPPALPEVASTGRRFPDTHAMMARINKVRPEWGKPAHWSGKEMHALGEALAQFEELTDSDWDSISRYMAASLPEGGAFWKPKGRGQLVENFSDVFGHVQRWEGKRRPSPSVPKPSAPIPERKILTRAEMAEMMKP